MRVALGLAIACALCVALTPCRTPAQETRAPRTHALQVAERGSGPCTLVLMHGYGASPDDLVPMAATIASSVPMRVLAPGAPVPYPHDPRGRAWFDPHATDVVAQVRAARRAIDDVIETAVATGARRVIVGGFSQGGIMSIEMALAGAHRPDAIAVLSGRALGHPASAYRRLHGMPIFASHGTADPLVPFANGERFVARATEAGAEVRFERFDGVHQIPQTVDAALTEWLRGVCAR